MFLISRCAKQATIANHIFTSPALQSRRWFLSNIFSRNPLMAAARVRWLQISLYLSLSFFFFLILFYFNAQNEKKGKLGRFVVCAFRAACKLNRIQLQYNHFLFYFCCMCPRIKNHLFLRKHPFGKSYRIVLRAPWKPRFLYMQIFIVLDAPPALFWCLYV